MTQVEKNRKKFENQLDKCEKCDKLSDHAKQSMLIIQKKKQILRHNADAFQMESVERITYKTDVGLDQRIIRCGLTVT